MTPMHSAARADQQHTWPASPAISAIAQPGNPLVRSHGATCEIVSRQIARSLIAGWKWLENKRTQQLASRRLRLAETISLGEKRSVSIVQVDGLQYLIGCSSGSVQLLAVLNGQDAGSPRPADKEAAS